jgi:hypothetical protein
MGLHFLIIRSENYLLFLTLNQITLLYATRDSRNWRQISLESCLGKYFLAILQPSRLMKLLVYYNNI